MKNINCEIEILTPMFLGGAPQEQNGKILCELRTQSIKGTLRYWYRTLIGQENTAIKESALFGSSDEKIGVSKVRIKTEKRNLTIYDKTQFPKITEYMFKHPTRGFQMNPLDYLAYGPVDNRKQIARNAFSPSSTFGLVLSLNGCTATQCVEFSGALFLWLYFGGLGSRSRKGYGAIKLLNEEAVFKDQDWFSKNNPGGTLRNLITDVLPAKLPYSKEYSYLDMNTKYWISKKKVDTWEKCLSMLGRDYHNWRQVLPVAHGREVLGTPLLHGSPNFVYKRRATSYFLTVFKNSEALYRYGILHIPSDYSKDTPIPSDIQKQHHDKFQKEIEKTATREV